ncbi:uncharacterized protein LOC124890777 isoform X2 [Capsicum annuum]|uniref:uncharacterized protein LOC124890777 isoform X2 n=1 Tax=Capsicum annuum TaxID=4072 RepID=UPI0007BEE1CA|nr:uncharacterized protein LOC124890777 isoform X2 [Capsicum annuum]
MFCNLQLLPIKTNSDLCRVHITNDTTKPVCMMLFCSLHVHMLLLHSEIDSSCTFASTPETLILQLCLFPFRCHFNIDFTDSNVTITATVSEALAERILSLTVDQIYDKVVVQKQPLSIAGINRQLDRELFKLQLQKSAFRFPDQKPDALAIASFTKTEQTGI